METDSRSRLVESLKELHLPTVRECFEDEAERARREALSYEEYLLEIIDRERDERRQRRIARRLRQSRLPLEKTLASFDRRRLPRKVDAQVTMLLDGSFLDRAENVLAFGNPGSGKTHLLCAIAQELIYRDRQILFTPSSLLVQELLMAKRDLRMKHALRRLAKYEALIIDDIGYVQQNRQEMEVLFVLLAERYERASVMITSSGPQDLIRRAGVSKSSLGSIPVRTLHSSSLGLKTSDKEAISSISSVFL